MILLLIYCLNALELKRVSYNLVINSMSLNISCVNYYNKVYKWKKSIFNLNNVQLLP